MATWIKKASPGGLSTRLRQTLPRLRRVAAPRVRRALPDDEPPPGDERPSEGPSEQPRARRAAAVRHLVLAALLWLTYLAYWRVVIARGVGQEALISFGVIVFFVAGVWTGTRAWVEHNRRLARRFEGRRATRRSDGVAVAVDFHRRRIRVKPEADIRHASRVVIEIEGDEKHFRSESLEADPTTAGMRA